jgi:streptomycin 6-kinase
MFDRYLKRWNLTRDGVPIVTHSSDLLPVRQDGRPAMLKIARVVEERRGAILMRWWDGDGAACVLAHDDDAMLLKRATDSRSLAAMAHDGRDDEASRILCDVAARLHAPRNAPPPDLIPLSGWFAELEPAAARHGGVFRHAVSTARDLLATPQDVCVLHGDLHHGNVLDFGAHGWRAIDPKGLIGERGFDFANIFCNPDSNIATSPGRLARQTSVVAEAAHLDRARLLRWSLAYACLSAAWTIGEGGDANLALTVAEITAAETSRYGD